jgi:hypothetical protein
VLLEGVEVGGDPVHEGRLHVLLFLLAAGGLLVDLLADCLEGAVLDPEVVLLQLGLDVLDEQFVALHVQFLLEDGLLVVVDDGDEQFVDEAHVVVAHQDVVGLVDGLHERVQEGLQPALALEPLQRLQDRPALHLPAVVLQHHQHVGSHRHVHRVIAAQQDQGVVGDGRHHLEVLLLVVVAQRFQEFQDLYLVLEDGLSPLLIRSDRLVQDSHQSFNAVDLDELRPRVPNST